MARIKITAPVRAFQGDFAGLIFRWGVAVADDADPTVRAAMEYCRRRGYAITTAEEPLIDRLARTTKPERPKDYASKPEWVAYAVASGADPADAEAATKAELVALFGTEDSKEGPLP